MALPVVTHQKYYIPPFPKLIDEFSHSPSPWKYNLRTLPLYCMFHAHYYYYYYRHHRNCQISLVLLEFLTAHQFISFTFITSFKTEFVQANRTLKDWWDFPISSHCVLELCANNVLNSSSHSSFSSSFIPSSLAELAATSLDFIICILVSPRLSQFNFRYIWTVNLIYIMHVWIKDISDTKLHLFQLNAIQFPVADLCNLPFYPTKT